MNVPSQDVLITGARIYTVNSAFDVVEAMVVREGVIIAVGSRESLEHTYTIDHVVDLKGRMVYPGWIDPHCHFAAYGAQTREVDFTGAASFEECILRAKAFPANGKWLTGAGWNHSLWPDAQLPDKTILDRAFPDRPVFMMRADRHCALVNSTALALAGIDAQTHVDGGMVEIRDGQPTGILVDAAMKRMFDCMPVPDPSDRREALLAAQAACFGVGLTGVADAGLDLSDIQLMDQLHREGDLRMNIYAMINPNAEAKEFFHTRGPLKTDFLTATSFKYFTDGAIGSHGAWMQQPYLDAPGNCGLQFYRDEDLLAEAEENLKHGFQMNTHAIGDAANHQVLDIYGRVLKGRNDKRWRIEHAQVLLPGDIDKFGTFSIIPSVQTTHATSDMPWVESKLGKDRLVDAYATRRLMMQNGLIANGSDFPVESIDPLKGFYSAVTRQNEKGDPAGGFMPDERLTREEALRAMTSWAAYANFDDDRKGSLEPGKFADFVVTDEDIMRIPDADIPEVKVYATYIRGQQVYARENVS